MTTAPGNPVLAPLRRWVLYSRTNLVLTALAVIVVLFLIGRVVGAPPPPRPPNAHGFGASLPATGEAMAVSYELVEVSESTVAGKTTQWTTSNAPATAMAYLHAFVDISLSDAEWLNRLAHYTADEPGLSFTAARPQVPVAITGSTRSELVTGAAGQRVVHVTIPTQAGPVRVTTKVLDTSAGQKWAVDTPLPALDLSTVAPLHPSAVAVPSVTSSTPAITSTSSPTSAAPPSSPPSSSPSKAQSTERLPDPVPAPGPLPIPNLDTPIPGAL
ncbi:hypothetical protein [Rhodococcus sp. PSBB049]|uniref:hypothetical protein n=1 Tax=Rhodococcus sp. PSBB049 TaxID=2812863 RepID=UPI00197CFE64|nr:hypothetical protein [Rhodococcus sp. PSBB049]QSE72465.1 hypothetical protein JYA91_29535 [Rhodococcus sp. PSBB049]